MSFDLENETLADPKALLNVRVGLASPLWPLFTGVAMTGAAWWWMTRWAQPANLEAMFGAAARAIETAPRPVVLAEPAVEAAEAVVEAVAEPAVHAVAEAEPAVEAAAESVSETAEAVAEPVVEATPEPVLEALVETTPELEGDLEPVGGEAAPISPLLEALAPEPVAKSKPKKKLAEPQPDDASAAD